MHAKSGLRFSIRDDKHGEYVRIWAKSVLKLHNPTPLALPRPKRIWDVTKHIWDVTTGPGRTPARASSHYLLFKISMGAKYRTDLYNLWAMAPHHNNTLQPRIAISQPRCGEEAYRVQEGGRRPQGAAGLLDDQRPHLTKSAESILGRFDG